MRIVDWSSDVCSSDLLYRLACHDVRKPRGEGYVPGKPPAPSGGKTLRSCHKPSDTPRKNLLWHPHFHHRPGPRSEEHTSELQSLMRISYAAFCLKKKKQIRYTYIS